MLGCAGGGEGVTVPSLAGWRAAVAVWLLAWVVLVITAGMSGMGAILAAVIAFGLGRHGGPSDWKSHSGDFNG